MPTAVKKEEEEEEEEEEDFVAPSDSRYSNSFISAKKLSYLNKPCINGKLIYSAFR